MKQVQIPQELFVLLLHYHLMEDNSHMDEIRIGLDREEADKQADQAKKKAAQYEKKLTEIAPMVKEMERFAEKYSADPDEILPEVGTLETGKSYREKRQSR